MTDRPPLTELLLEHLRLARDLRGTRIAFDPDRCTGSWQCYDVCPIGCWVPDRAARVAAFRDGERCIACGACVLQCPEDAIALLPRRVWRRARS